MEPQGSVKTLTDSRLVWRMGRPGVSRIIIGAYVDVPLFWVGILDFPGMALGVGGCFFASGIVFGGYLRTFRWIFFRRVLFRPVDFSVRFCYGE